MLWLAVLFKYSFLWTLWLPSRNDKVKILLLKYLNIYSKLNELLWKSVTQIRYQGLCVCRSPVWGLNITSGHFRSSVLFEVQSFEVGSFPKFSRSKFSRSKLGLSKFSRSKFSPSKLGLLKFSRSKLGRSKFSRSKFSRWIRAAYHVEISKSSCPSQEPRTKVFWNWDISRWMTGWGHVHKVSSDCV